MLGGAWRATDLLAVGIAAAGWATAGFRAVDPLHFLAMGFAGTLLAVVAWCDFRTLRAPNVVVLPGLAAVLVVASFFGLSALVQAASGALMAFVLMLIVALAGRGAMGLGDVKFAALTGAIVGLRLVLPVLVLAFVVGGIIAAVVLAFRLRGRKDVIAFTPLLAVGAITAMALYPGYLAG